MRESRLPAGLPIRAGVLTATVVLMLACGSSGSDGPLAPDAGSEPAHPDAVQGAECTRYARSRTRCLPASDPTLTQRLEARIAEICAARVAAEGTSWSAAQVNACSAAAEAAPCDLADGIVEPAECLAKPGARAEGADCHDNSQCQSAICVVTLTPSDGGATGAQCGHCQPSIAVGETCGSGPGKCAQSTVCTGTPATCKTVTRALVDQPCDGAAKCGGGLYCSTTSKTCVQRVGESAACTGSQECASGLRCDPAAKVCVKTKTAASGEACDANTSCSGGAEEGCSAQVGGVCPRVVLKGEACVAGDRTQSCELFTSCIDGQCRLFSDGFCK